MKNEQYLVLIIFLIFLLLFLTYQQFKTFKKSFLFLKKFFGEEKTKIEIPQFEEVLNKEKEKKEFKSEDGKLKFSFFSDWQEIPKENWPESSTDEKIIFLAKKINLKDFSLNILVVRELYFEKQKSFDEILETLKRKIEKEGGEIKNLKIEDTKNIIFDLIYKIENHFFSGKGKVFLNTKIYFFEIMASEKEISEIINSIEVVD